MIGKLVIPTLSVGVFFSFTGWVLYYYVNLIYLRLCCNLVVNGFDFVVASLILVLTLLSCLAVLTYLFVNGFILTIKFLKEKL